MIRAALVPGHDPHAIAKQVGVPVRYVYQIARSVGVRVAKRQASRLAERAAVTSPSECTPRQADILRAVRSNRESVSALAARLGVSRQYIYATIKTLGDGR